jgi:hypothetical protein
MYSQIIKVFIGYDPVESTAWHTMAHSILDRSSTPVALIPVNVKNLHGIYSRPRDQKQSNEFSFSRFLVPFLCNYQGYAIFFDCDMLLKVDINKIFDEINRQPGKALYVVKHDYEPKNDIKYLNAIQYKYPRKNWSSVVLWDCSHPANNIVTPEFVNTSSALDLHRFTWLRDEDIGELDVKWNWLVGEYNNPPEDICNIHWTIGGPYFNEYKNAEFASDWFEENNRMNFCLQKDG